MTTARTSMKNILFALLLAISFATLNAQVRNTARRDTAKTLKRLELKKADFDREDISIDKGNVAKKMKDVKPVAPKSIKADDRQTTSTSKAFFPGGERAIRDFIRKTQQYPKECRQSRATGKVTVAITIASDGTPRDARVEKSSGNEHFDREALRVAGLMPKWTPAKDDNGEEFTYRATILFRPGR